MIVPLCALPVASAVIFPPTAIVEATEVVLGARSMTVSVESRVSDGVKVVARKFVDVRDAVTESEELVNVKFDDIAASVV